MYRGEHLHSRETWTGSMAFQFSPNINGIEGYFRSAESFILSHKPSNVIKAPMAHDYYCCRCAAWTAVGSLALEACNTRILYEER
ncbi:unnamed protein product [Chondrus crispus]|uniref:Uncharacterized protein n=1 Tax=Chondrus crispus TaxID=2769 RepID=R7Q9F8_CHOCR|nr:unnamed protein product [Chondrus crispus]XP_005718145.1 unnamed protein product [Chondrus crispus]CDF34694.1 unnamed protein product [Chondrus crispus]CDF38260.1 unnamed protein product [Chondrus crispus]|eukprot:XP_005714513.1 unnamed protein product [Chondrus crispus]